MADLTRGQADERRALYAEFRELTLEAAEVQWDGLSTGLRSIGLDLLADVGDPVVGWAIDRWYLSVPLFQLVVSVFLVGFVRHIGSPAIKRVDAAFPQDDAAFPQDDAAFGRDDAGGPIRPDRSDEPVGLTTVRTRGVAVERGSTLVRLPDITLDGPGLTVVVGPNGAGKSTLLGTLIGRFEPVVSRGIAHTCRGSFLSVCLRGWPARS